MVGRVLLSPTNFRISKPGFEVTTTSDLENLIIDGATTGLGLYQTGSATVSGGAKASISYSNSFGTIPVLVLQYYRSGTSDCIGGGCYYKIDYTSTLEDTEPPYRMYEGTIDSSVSVGYAVYHSTSTIFIENKDAATRVFKYNLFYPSLASGPGGTYDMVPNSVDWTGLSGSADGSTKTTNTQTIGGIGGIITLRLRASSSFSSGQDITVLVNGTSAGSITSGGSSVNFNISNGDSIGFKSNSSSAISQTMHVDNISTSTNDLDTFTINLTTTPDYTPSNTWSDVSTSGNSGGVSYLTTTSTSTMSGINQTVSLSLIAARVLTGTETVQLYKNGSYVTTLSSGTTITFSAVSGDTIGFLHGAMSSASLTFSIYNNTIGYEIDTFTSTITDSYAGSPDYTFDAVNWDFIDAEVYFGATATAQTNSQTMSGVNQTVSMRISLASTLFGGTTIYVYKNGSLLSSISSGTTIDFTVVNNDAIYFKGTKPPNGTYSSTANVYNLSTGAFLDSFSVNLSANNGPPL